MGLNLAPWHREPVAVARLDVTGPDGSATVVVTDERWETAPGLVESERFFRGEDHVVRAAPPVWTPAVVVEPPNGHLRLAELPPVQALASLPRWWWSGSMPDAPCTTSVGS